MIFLVTYLFLLLLCILIEKLLLLLSESYLLDLSLDELFFPMRPFLGDGLKYFDDESESLEKVLFLRKKQ